MIEMYVLSLDQLSHKTAAKRRTDRTIDPAIVVLFNVFLYLPGHCNHVRKDQIAAVKSVIIHADQVILL